MLKQHRRAIAAVVCVSAWATLAPAAPAKPATGTCPAGFNIGPVARSDYAALPRSAAAIEAGLTDEAGTLAGFDRFDKNGDGVVCVQLSNGFETNNRPFGQYFYNLTDDTASTNS
jgi:hypothetical protein